MLRSDELDERLSTASKLLREMRSAAATAAGERACAVWDVDGTLFDPAPRMLATVHAFGCQEAQLGDVRPTWQETAQTLSLEPEEFYAFWYEHYWDPPHFLLDRPIPETVEAAALAEQLGLATVALTGRTQENEDITREQLTRAGLHPAMVLTKPSMRRRTPAFKREALLELARDGWSVACFTTDSEAELAVLDDDEFRAALPSVKLLLVDEGRIRNRDG